MIEENLGIIGKLVIPKNVQQLIDYLHYKIGSTEWSGILFYKITKGSIDKLKDLEFTVTFIYPMNIGSSAYTEFDYTGEIVNAYNVFEEGLECSTGLVHSHHNMTAFFSDTDVSELQDNAKNYNYYTSLIVNFAHEYCAKIAIPSKTSSNLLSKFKNALGKYVSISLVKEEKDILLLGDLKVVIENKVTVPEWLPLRIKVLQSIKEEVKVPFIRDFNTFSNDEYLGKDTIKKYNFTKDIDFSKVDKKKQFLTSLINLNEDNKNGSLLFSLDKLKDLPEAEQELFAQALEENIEILHDKVYGSNDFFRKHCAEALSELLTHEKKYEELDLFDVICQTLSDYAAL
jgi:hypothetical protein